MLAALGAAQRIYASHGFTTAQDGGTDAGTLALLMVRLMAEGADAQTVKLPAELEHAPAAGRHRGLNRWWLLAAVTAAGIAAVVHPAIGRTMRGMSVRDEFPDATHNCWAFVAGPPGSLRRRIPPLGPAHARTYSACGPRRSVRPFTRGAAGARYSSSSDERTRLNTSSFSRNTPQPRATAVSGSSATLAGTPR